MAINSPNDPRRATPGDEYRRNAPLDAELQADPELAEGPASGSRIAIYAVAIVVILGAVFYGLSNSSDTNVSSTNPPASTSTADNAKPPVAPGVRDVTPNRESGTTTGAAPAQPAQPAQPPQSGPTGTQVDQNKAPANPPNGAAQ